MPSISKNDCCPAGSILALINAYQEYLVAYKSWLHQWYKGYDHCNNAYLGVKGLGAYDNDVEDNVDYKLFFIVPTNLAIP